MTRLFCDVDRGRVVDTVTRWTVGGSNPGVGENFRTRPDRPWGPPKLIYNGYRVSFPGLKRPERGVDHPPLSSAEVRGRVELHLYSLWDFVTCSRVNFTFLCFLKFQTIYIGAKSLKVPLGM